MLLGTPDPYTVLAGDTDTKSPLARLFCCCFGAQDQLSGWEVRKGSDRLGVRGAERAVGCAATWHASCTEVGWVDWTGGSPPVQASK
eukprot:1158163-Pelagomonas_calceolata.AAC.3